MKLKESIRWKLEAIVLAVVTGLALLTSCQKEQVEIVNPPVQVVAEQNYSEDIVGDWRMVSVTFSGADDGNIVQTDMGWCSISDRFTADYGFGSTNADCDVVMYDEITWSISGDSLFIDGDRDCKIVSITDTHLITSPQPNTTTLYERVN